MKQFKRLGQQGVSHLMVPLAVLVLVAIAGAFTVVAKNANSTNLTAARASTPASRRTEKPRGVLVVFSQKGRFSKVQIRAVSAAPSASGNSASSRVCGGVLSSRNNYTVVKVLPGKSKNYAAARYSCDAIGGGNQYQVTLSKDSNFNNDYHQQVDVDAGYCTMVHFDPTRANKVPYVNGHCQSNDDDNPAKANAAIRVLPKLTAGKTSIKGYVEVAVNGEITTRAMCTGQVNISVIDQRASSFDSRRVQTFQAPLKFARITNRFPYCVAVIPSASIKSAVSKGHTYAVSANFPGSAYINPVGDTAAASTITIQR